MKLIPSMNHVPNDFINYRKQIVQENIIESLSANPTKWSIALKQFVGFCRRIVWAC